MKKERHRILPIWSFTIQNSLLTPYCLSYALAYHLTSAIVISKLPFRSFVSLPFTKFIAGTQLNPLKFLAQARCLYILFPCSPLWKTPLSPAPHTIPGYVYAACPSELNSKATFSREVLLIISVGKSLTFLWTSRGSHMVLIIFYFVLQQCLLCLKDEI